MTQTKNIKDYLPLYLGCEVVGTGKKPGSKHYTLVGVTLDGGCLFRTIPEGFSIDLGHDWKPILRPLSDVKDAEWGEIENEINFFFDGRGMDGVRDNFLIGTSEYRMGWELVNDALISLRKRGVDLFNLIPEGLAIDKTTLK